MDRGILVLCGLRMDPIITSLYRVVRIVRSRKYIQDVCLRVLTVSVHRIYLIPGLNGNPITPRQMGFFSRYTPCNYITTTLLSSSTMLCGLLLCSIHTDSLPRDRSEEMQRGKWCRKIHFFFSTLVFPLITTRHIPRFKSLIRPRKNPISEIIFSVRTVHFYFIINVIMYLRVPVFGNDIFHRKLRCSGEKLYSPRYKRTLIFSYNVVISNHFVLSFNIVGGKIDLVLRNEISLRLCTQ